MISSSRAIGVLGFAFGVLAPFIGLFFGLQVHVLLGNILTFPWILLSLITRSPFGEWSGFMRIFAVIFSGITWSMVVIGMQQVFYLFKRR